MSYRINTEKYYQRFIDLQEKLRKSEEERLKLEIRLNKMMQIIQTEEQRHYDNLSSQYKQFWEEDKKRQDRNNYILRILDRVENQSEALEEKARRLSLIRDQYYGMPRRHYDDSRPSYVNQQFYDNDSYNPSPERDMYSPLGAKEYNMNKNFNLQHQEKMEYLNKYLENIDTVKNNDKNGAMKSPRSFSSKSPIRNKTTNLKLDDLGPSTDLGYKVENFLTNRYSYQNFKDDDSTTSTPSGSPRYNETPSIRNRSKSPKSTRKFEMDDLRLGSNTNYHFDENTRISRFPRRINRRTKQIPKNVSSSDYKNSLKKLQKIQENSRKILSQHIRRTNDYRNEGSNYHKRPILYENDLIWNYPVASDFGLNMNDIYQPDKVIQKYLMEKYNTYLSDRYFGYPPNPCDSYHDRMNFDNLPHHTYRRHDYIRDLPNRYESTSHVPNDYFTYPRSPRTYNETHLTSSPTLNKLDEHYSKPPKGNHISGSDNALRKYDELRKDEKTHGIHFNDNDQILEYDKNKPSREYDKKYELNKNYKEDNISLNKTNGKYDFVDHERDRGSIKQTKDHDKDEDTSLSRKDNLNIDENTNASSNYSNNGDDPIKSEQKNFPNVSMNNTQKALDINSLNNQKNITSNLNSVEKPTMNGDVKDDIDEDKVKQNTIPSVDNIIPEEVSYKSFSSVEPVDKNKGCQLIKINENDDIDANNIEKSKDSISLISPEESINKDTELIAGDKQINEDTKSDRDYEEKNVVINQDHTESIKTDYNESQLYDENGTVDKLNENQEYGQKGQQIQYDENGQPIQFDENGQPIQYHENDQPVPHDESGQQIQYDENGQPIQFDENGQPIQYHENDQPVPHDQNGPQIQYGENGQPIQFDENGQPIQYHENDQPVPHDQNGPQIQYDENGQPIQFDENGQPIQYHENDQPVPHDQNGPQIQYDENGQPIQFDENGQPIQYHENDQPVPHDQNGPQIQYDENGQPIQYDETGQPIQYDANGQPIQYDQNGQQIQYDDNGQPIQFDENGQAIQYDANGQPIQYDQNGHPVQYDENGQMLQYDANGQLLQYDENGMPIQYDQNGQSIQYDENGQPLQYDENGQQIHYDANGQPIQYESSAEPYHEEKDFEKVEDPIANQEVNEVKTNGSSKANVFEMLDTDTESIKQDTKVSNDSDFELTT